MKTTTRVRNATVLLIAGIILFSCNDFDNKFEVLTDVYVINKKFGNEIKSATAYFAYGNQALTSATVTMPNNTDKVTLEPYPESVYNMAKEPKDSDFSSTAPVNGTYVFSVTGSEGETLSVSDVLTYQGLAIPQFTKAMFNGTPKNLELEWSLVAGSDGYVVKFYDLNWKLIFNGYGTGSETKKYTISTSANTGYWSEPAETGKQYILQIHAFKYDTDANSSNFIYNVSEISIGEKLIVWGEN